MGRIMSNGSSKRTAILAAGLALVVGVAAWGAIGAWANLSGISISLHGWLAMLAACLGMVVIGGGLMWLSFYSARRGYDDKVGKGG
jgi:hypothetical protein